MPPLVHLIYTADPSAHSFVVDGKPKIFVYPSHDIEAHIPFNDRGDQYAMQDYRVLEMEDLGAPVKIHEVALRVEDVPWVSKQFWAPDAAQGPDGKYYLFFPARNKKDIFQIGVAVSDHPQGPFTADPEPIPGSFSIDPCSFVDDDGQAYLYFGGIWGGQLQCYSQPDGGEFDASKDGPHEPAGEGVVALCPRVGKLSKDMHTFDGKVRELEVLDEDGKRLAADDHERRFFEAAWMHRRTETGLYYFSYSTGDTHRICYATGTSPFGPFTYRGVVLNPVKSGWTTHHSIVEHKGKTILFYHDCELSKGVDHLRSVKAMEIFYDDKGGIIPSDPQ